MLALPIPPSLLADVYDDFDPSKAQLRAYYNLGSSDDPKYGPRAEND